MYIEFKVYIIYLDYFSLSKFHRNLQKSRLNTVIADRHKQPNRGHERFTAAGVSTNKSFVTEKFRLLVDDIGHRR